MEQTCQGIILSQKELKKGHSSLKFLTSEMGKIYVSLYCFSIEKNAKNLPIPTGACVEALVRSIPKYPDKYYISDVKIQHIISGIEHGLEGIGCVMFLLEVIDLLLLDGDLFPYYSKFLEQMIVFRNTGNSDHILFFLTYFLFSEGWLKNHPLEGLSAVLIKFIETATQYAPIPENVLLTNKEKYVLSQLFANIVKNIRNKHPLSIELLRF